MSYNNILFPFGINKVVMNLIVFFRTWLETTKMYKVDLPVDDSKDKVVEARRSAERARKARFFNPRLRVMGLDLDALNQQVLENKYKRSCEKQRDRDFGNYKHSSMSFASVRLSKGSCGYNVVAFHHRFVCEWMKEFWICLD